MDVSFDHRPTRRVALVQHSWVNANLGVVALSECSLLLVEQAAELAGVDVSIDGINAGDASALPVGVTPVRLGVSVRPWRGLIAWRAAVRAFRAYDVVIDIGEGDGFAGIYGPKRLMWQMFLKSAAIAARARLVLAPQTFGPFRGRLQARAFKAVARRSALCVSRDPVSHSACIAISSAAQNLLVADVAFALEPDSAWRLPQTSSSRVGLNVSGLLWSATPQDPYYVAGYRDAMKAIAGSFVASRAVELHLVGHVGAASGAGGELSDEAAATELAREIGAGIVSPSFPSPSAAKGYISSLDFFVGSRMHACIAAASSLVPVLALSYSRKFEDTFSTVGLDVTLDPASEPASELVCLVLERYDNRHTQRGALLEASIFASDSHRRYAALLGDQLMLGRR